MTTSRITVPRIATDEKGHDHEGDEIQNYYCC